MAGGLEAERAEDHPDTFKGTLDRERIDGKRDREEIMKNREKERECVDNETQVRFFPHSRAYVYRSICRANSGAKLVSWDFYFDRSRNIHAARGTFSFRCGHTTLTVAGKLTAQPSCEVRFLTSHGKQGLAGSRVIDRCTQRPSER